MMKLIYRDKEWELAHGMTIRDAIIKIGLNPEAVLPLRQGKLISEDNIGQENDVITLIAVVSGG
jgi:sulfur carrier protein ThiS